MLWDIFYMASTNALVGVSGLLVVRMFDFIPTWVLVISWFVLAFTVIPITASTRIRRIIAGIIIDCASNRAVGSLLVMVAQASFFLAIVFLMGFIKPDG